MQFMKYRYLYLLISLVVIAAGLTSLVVNGFKLSIDFTGGSLWEIEVPNDTLTHDGVTETVDGLYEVASVQESGAQRYILRGKEMNNDVKNQVLEKMMTQYGPIRELRFETIGPTLGRELMVKTLTAAFLVACLITAYIWKQFQELKFGVCAVLAMLHDSLVLIGVFSILGFLFGVEVDVLFVTAVMTTLSFSIHDTIVVYDRIREIRRKRPRLSFSEVIDLALLQTFSRSLNNSITIIVMLLSLALLGGESIRWFVVALLVGALTGTYSSTFTAAPLLLVWDDVLAWSKKSRAKSKS